MIETCLHGTTLVEGIFYLVTQFGDNINARFCIHMPNPTNPSITAIKIVYSLLNVDSIETKPDDYKIYYGKSGFLSNNICDNGDLSEGILIENGPS